MKKIITKFLLKIIFNINHTKIELPNKFLAIVPTRFGGIPNKYLKNIDYYLKAEYCFYNGPTHEPQFVKILDAKEPTTTDSDAIAKVMFMDGHIFYCSVGWLRTMEMLTSQINCIGEKDVN